jgi:tetratricopeptide (TPR) repeat protein
MTQIEDTSPTPAPLPWRIRRRPSLVVLGILLGVILILGGAGYAGYQAGLAQRGTQAQATRAADLEHQYELGVSDLAAGRYEVAQARFEYIVQLDPSFRDASQKLAQVRAAIAATATPTLAPPTATPSPQPPTATQSHAAEDLFAQAQAQYAAADWDGVIATLTQLHGVDPTFQAVKVNGMLYVAYRNSGIAQISGNDIEGGMFDLDQAEAIGPLDSDALNYRAWGRLYLAAQSYWGLNWQQAMVILQQLYLIAPYFHDTSTLLYQATVNYADQLAKSGDACGAAQHYTEAQALKVDPKIAEALATAEASCAKTPTAAESGTPGKPGTPGTPGTPARAAVKSTPTR